MKRLICCLLVLCLTLSLAACGGGENTVVATESVMETTVPTTEPTTEATLSPEEQLLSSIPERTRQAYELGLVALEQLEDLERSVTIGEAVQMLQRAYTLRNGTQSSLLNDIGQLNCTQESACLGWIGRLPIALYVEALEPDSYQDYIQWMNYIVKYAKNGTLYEMLPATNISLYWDNDSTLFQASWGWYELGWTTKMGNIFYNDVMTENTQLEECSGHGSLLAFSALMYDQTTGLKVVECSANNTIAVDQIMTVESMAEMTRRLYYSFYVEPDPVAYEECVTAEPSILTEELLNRQTNLPDASCAHLPSEWHGVAMDDLRTYYDDGAYHYDGEIFEYEIQAVKDAGFNYIGLQLDFSWLQGSGYHRGDPLDGKLDLNRLKTLDQILAWCMERDIHLDIRCAGSGGHNEDIHKVWNDSAEDAQKFAEIWKVLAERYAQVPNTYLSFTLLEHTRRGNENPTHNAYLDPAEGWWNQQKEAVDFVKPAVEAIRSISPERCMIVDISGRVAAGEEVLELGVALAMDMSAQNDFFVIPSKQYLNQDFYLNMQWPYNGTCTAESMMDSDVHWKTLREVATMAQENGLGFMISGWGELPFVWHGTLKRPTVRYSDATYQSFILDVTQTLESYNYGWCYEVWYGTNGITFSAPLIQNVTYEQIGDYPMYYDTAMLSWFRKINNIA